MDGRVGGCAMGRVGRSEEGLELVLAWAHEEMTLI